MLSNCWYSSGNPPEASGVCIQWGRCRDVFIHVAATGGITCVRVNRNGMQVKAVLYSWTSTPAIAMCFFCGGIASHRGINMYIANCRCFLYGVEHLSRHCAVVLRCQVPICQQPYSPRVTLGMLNVPCCENMESEHGTCHVPISARLNINCHMQHGATATVVHHEAWQAVTLSLPYTC